ncbi:jg13541 [Pararge aegeria aegeria]|uniref:Jg13541 protein n=1 Tax=Pararge aegeria aegeria TaxID=348720 RepID=A0A8S4SB15_9NEOP|nr:jg13541 [Pararge aegeria aegeria]
MKELKLPSRLDLEKMQKLQEVFERTIEHWDTFAIAVLVAAPPSVRPKFKALKTTPVWIGSLNKRFVP